ncbi:DUF4352 domain-containing protein [Modestobacter marinus]|uniref:Mpr protein n=1 Tax=Modestobacter marinus TaxID=477641 RepID=A0A846LJM1_9ACTN|nr:DUF4352 domain-containing protein [Modestobacter marinus]NIH68273.1 hypothetical protein [Modestobacter marinus]GGL79038.1 Mpr protein [Modestobacter marinus]
MTHPPTLEERPEQPPQAKAKKPLYKRAWFIILAVIVVFGVAANMGGGDTDNEATASGTDAAPDVVAPVAEPVAEEEPSNPGIGEPAADGKFNFVVNGVDCSATEIGNEYLGTTAQGQFCVVDVTISNIGDEAQSFFGDNAKLFNAEGQEFSADSEAAIYLEDSGSLYEEINPGNSLNSKVIFDVPAGTVPTAIELHDSAFSGGVTVDLQ